MRVLLTGVSGFVGPYLIDGLHAAGHLVIGLGRTAAAPPLADDYRQISQLPTEREGWATLLREVKPDAIVHLAAQSHVPTSWAHIAETFMDNLIVTASLLESAVADSSVSVMMTIGSGEEYGPQSDRPIRETDPPHPQNPYALSKATVAWLWPMIMQAGRNGDKVWYHARPFNHIGPGQRLGFVVADICQQIVAVEDGTAPALRLGNMSAVRDFLDVRDVAAAYVQLLTSRCSSGVYNVCSGIGRPISELVHHLIGLSHQNIRIVQDPERMRPSDVPIFVGDASKLVKATGWRPQNSLADTLRDTLEWWRTHPDAGAWI